MSCSRFVLFRFPYLFLKMRTYEYFAKPPKPFYRFTAFLTSYLMQKKNQLLTGRFSPTGPLLRMLRMIWPPP
jgi:hypothetical protein